MRDYVVKNRRTGGLRPVAEMSRAGLERCLAQALRTRAAPILNPGVTVDSFIERLRLELFIREMGLRD